MKNNLLSFKALLLYPMTMFALHVGGAPSNRIELPDHVPSKALKNAVLLHHLERDTHVQMTFTLPCAIKKNFKNSSIGFMIRQMSNTASI